MVHAHEVVVAQREWGGVSLQRQCLFCGREQAEVTRALEGERENGGSRCACAVLSERRKVGIAQRFARRWEMELWY